MNDTSAQHPSDDEAPDGQRTFVHESVDLPPGEEAERTLAEPPLELPTVAGAPEDAPAVPDADAPTLLQPLAPGRGGFESATIDEPPPPEAFVGVDAPRAPAHVPGSGPPGSGPPPGPRWSGPDSGGGSSRRGASSRRSSLRGPRREGDAVGADALFGDKYELLEEIARGGMGVVYKARDIDLERVVALKVMLSGVYASDDDRRRFVLEASASAKLKHPHIVPVYDIGEWQGQLFFTMDFVEGEPLSKRKRDLDRDTLLRVMTQVVGAVAYAHQRGIIHRDLKPANIMMTRDDQPLIMDFGLAKQVEVVDEEGRPSLATREGSVMGTPHYMPPEQADGLVSEIDVRSDVYSLGVIIYELWAGQLPFQGRNVTELLRQVFEVDPTPLRVVDPTIDRDLEAICLKAMEKDKARRYESAADLERDLERVAQGLPVTARRATPLYRAGKWVRRHRRVLAVAAVVAGVAAAGLVYGVRARQGSAREAFAQRLSKAEDRIAEVAEAGTLAERGARLRRLAAAEGPTAERAAAAAELAASLEAERAALAAARAALSDDLDDERAREVDARLGAATAEVTALVEEAERLERYLRQLARAEAAVARARELAPELSSAATGDPAAAWAGVDTAADVRKRLEDYERLRLGDAAEAGQGARAGFQQALADAQGFSLAAMSLAMTDDEAGAAAMSWGEAGAAPRRLLATVSELERQAARQADERRFGLLAAAARELLAPLRAAADPETTVAAARALQREPPLRLQAARLAQGLVRAGQALSPTDAAEVQRLHLDSNRAYAEALLAMEAFTIFEVELQTDGAFRDEDRAALEEQRALLLGRTEALAAQLDELARIDADLDLEALAQRVRALEALAGAPGSNVQLEERRSAALMIARQRLVDRHRIAYERRAREAEEAAAGVPDDLLPSRLAELLGLWDDAQDAAAAAGSVLGGAIGEAFAADGFRRSAVAKAQLRRRAAEALAERRPAAALEQVVAALGVLADVPEEAGLRQSLASLERRLARRSTQPEGFVLVPGRTTELGEGDAARKREVADFYLAKREVTCAEYAEFLASDAHRAPALWAELAPGVPALSDIRPSGWEGTRPPEGWADLPVTGIGWTAARAFARWAGARLPTDEEWELAARYGAGSASRRYPWGERFADGDLRSVLRPPGDNPRDRTPLEVDDLGGNVSEWVVVRGASGELRPGARGASFIYPHEPLARTTRPLTPSRDYRGPQLGLRLAKEAR